MATIETMLFDTDAPVYGPREREMIDVIQAAEVPLLTSLADEFGAERGWAVCGPGSVVLGDLISHNTGIPMGERITGEHIEIEIGLFIPEQSSPYPPMDHSYLVYDAGNYTSLTTVDTVGKLLWEGHTQLTDAIHIDRHYRNEVMSNMWDVYRLGQYNPSTAYRLGATLWEHPCTERDLLQNYREFRDIMNSPQVFEDCVQTLSGGCEDVSAWWGQRLVRVMRATARLAGLKPSV